MESSAKTGVNAQNIFIQAAKTLYDDYINYQKKTDEAGKTKNNTNQNLMQNQNQLINRKRIDNKPRKNQGGCC